MREEYDFSKSRKNPYLDPFYSESNRKHLLKSIQQFEEGKTVEKTMEELEAMEED